MSSRHLLTASVLVCLALLGVVSTDTAAQSRSPAVESSPLTLTGKILFVREPTNPDGTIRSSSIFRINADGSAVRQLTPSTVAILDSTPSWSPGGGRIAYTRFNASLGKYDLHVMDSQGQQSQQITSGSEEFYAPLWGPRSTIAFTTEFTSGSGARQFCVGTIHADGREQHRLFCPPDPNSRPTRVHGMLWSTDGDFLYVDTDYTNGLEDDGFSVAYKIELQTRAVQELTTRHYYFLPQVAFAPDGSNAIYSERDVGITRVDFASDQETLLTDNGYAVRYSKDGSKIAFTRTFLVGDQRYDHLFVMDADGSNVRQLTTAQINNLEYRAVDWSKDSTQLLVNRTIYTQDGSQRRVARRALRIIDVNTRAVKGLPSGRATGGAWFQPY